jgi:hypothetical protein
MGRPTGQNAEMDQEDDYADPEYGRLPGPSPRSLLSIVWVIFLCGLGFIVGLVIIKGFMTI